MGTMGEIEALSGKMMDTLEARKLDVELMVSLGLGSKPARKDDPAGGEVLVMPYLREGAVVHRKYRKFVAKDYEGLRHWQDKDGVKCFYNEDVLRDQSLKGCPLIITEGEPDTWATLTAELTYPTVAPYEDGGVEIALRKCVSVPDGAPKERILDGNSPKYSYLIEALDAGLLTFADVPVVILAVDNDQPGTNLMYDLAERLGRARCKFVTYPLCSPEGAKKRGRDRCKDLGEVLEDWGAAGVKAALQGAKFLKVDGVFRMSELPPRPAPVILPIGIPLLSELIKIRLGDWSCSTGIPSMGKSTVINAIACNLAHHHGIKIAFASFEQDPTVDHRRNLRTWYWAKPVWHQTDREIAEADCWIDDHFVFMVPGEDDDVDLDWMLDKMEGAVVQHGAKLLVVDPWNEMDHARERDETTTEYTGRAIKAKRRFARKFQVHVHTVAHPTKINRKDGEAQVPDLYKIADSAHWYNKADLGWIVHQHDGYSYVWSQKSRYHDEIGRPGAVRGFFNQGTRRFDFSEQVFEGNMHLNDHLFGTS